MTPRHTIDDFVNAFGLRQKGKEFVGPCPVCKDGEDRFHVQGRATPARYSVAGIALTANRTPTAATPNRCYRCLRNGNAAAPVATPHTRAHHASQRNRPSHNRCRRATALRCITTRTLAAILYWP